MGRTAVEQAVLGRFPKKDWPSTGSSRPVRLTLKRMVAVIVYVDLEHERLRQEAALWRLFAARTLETKYRLEAIAGTPCLIVNYIRVSPARLRELDVQALVVGGHYTGLQHYAEAELAGLRAVLREAAWPTLGICGGFQLLAQVYGADVGPMAVDSETLPETPLPPDGLETGPDASGSLARRERGFIPARVLGPHPLFEGLGGQMLVFGLHSWEVKSVPEGFQLLAESDVCRVQALAHGSAPLFGVQFHPESYDEAHPDGRKILENFFRLAGEISRKVPESNLDSSAC
jgi:GMP synthase (glutamine-hydrolysing)